MSLSSFDYKARIADYIPKTPDESATKKELLDALEKEGDALLFREHMDAHITCSSLCLNADLTRVLMVHHNIYGTYCWTGGHADGDSDFLAVALREAREETGVKDLFPLSGQIVSIDALPVPEHIRHGSPVSPHIHYNVTYIMIASEKAFPHALLSENSDVKWIDIADIPLYCQEAHMLPIYDKLIARAQHIKKAAGDVFPKAATSLLAWYPTHSRPLPWRADREPYHVWLSEIMLQQTTVETVKGYYNRFLAQFPDIASLAAASQDDINKCWEGLGYYTRARNLHRAACEIMTEYGGVFPKTYVEIRRLSGVGDYTAGAIASLCFDLPTPAVDANVLRVAARLSDSFWTIDSPRFKTAITDTLSSIYAHNKGVSGMLTAAWMELGQTICMTRTSPRCFECPLGDICLSYQHKTANLLPTRTPKKPRRQEQYTVFVLSCQGKYALRRRKQKGVLSGMWEYPNIEGFLEETQAIETASAWGVEPIDIEKTAQLHHIFTHIEWEMHAVYLKCRTLSPQFSWFTATEIQDTISLPTAFRKVQDFTQK